MNSFGSYWLNLINIWGGVQAEAHQDFNTISNWFIPEEHQKNPETSATPPDGTKWVSIFALVCGILFAIYKFLNR